MPNPKAVSRWLTRAVVFSTYLWCWELSAQPLEFVGVATLAKQADVDGRPTVEGQNLFSGNRLNAQGGAVLLLRDGTDLRLGQATQARFEAGLGTLSATLDAGTLDFRSASQQFKLLTGNVVIKPQSLASHATVSVDSNELIIAAETAPLRVAVANNEWVVAPGEALRLSRIASAGGQSGSSSQQPPGGTSGSQSGASGPASGAGQATNWGTVAVCGIAGAGVGSVPLIVHKLSSSPDGDNYLSAFIPAGGVSGALLCKQFLPGNPPPPPNPPTCNLNITTNYPYQDGNGVAVSSPYPYTLGWTTTNAVSAQLSYSRFSEGSLAAAPPPHAVGPAAIPAGTQTFQTPQSTTNDWLTYRLTVQGANGQQVVCTAEVRIAPTGPPRCTITAAPTVFQAPNGSSTLTWTATNATTAYFQPAPGKPVAMSGSQKVASPPLVPWATYTYNMVAVGTNGRKAYCSARVTVQGDPCQSLVEELAFAFRTKMALQSISTILTVAALPTGIPLVGVGAVLPSSAVGGAVMKSVTAHNYAAKALAPSFEDACNAAAKCLSKNPSSANGNFVFYNALGREIGKCSWTSDGQGNGTAVAKTFGWGHAVGILSW